MTTTAVKSTVQARWELDFDNTAAQISESWLIRCDDGFVGIHPDYRDKDIVKLYATLMQVGYAKGWM